jgi:hypothetical protein
MLNIKVTVTAVTYYSTLQCHVMFFLFFFSSVEKNNSVKEVKISAVRQNKGVNEKKKKKKRSMMHEINHKRRMIANYRKLIELIK